MKFIGQVTVTDSNEDPDPVANPGDITDAMLVGHAGEGPLRDRGCTQRLLLGFLGGGTTTTEVEVWAIDGATLDGDPEDRVFYLVKAATTLTNQILVEVSGPVPAHGPFYIRQTDGTDDGVVKVAVQEG